MVYGAVNAFNPNSGYDLISRLLAIIILGGLGSIGGALGRGRLHDHPGVGRRRVWSPSWAIVVFYGALVLVLSVRPAGLFGQAGGRAQ